MNRDPTRRSSSSADRGRRPPILTLIAVLVLSDGRRAGAALLALLLMLAPRGLRAESALLAGFTGGGVVSARDGRFATHFRLGVALDLLDASGLVVSSRIESNDQLDLSAAAGAGFWAAGLRAGRGVPLGVGLSLAASRDHEARARIGARGTLQLGLWYGRVTLELDVTALAPFYTPETVTARDGVEVGFGLALRVVPWSGLRLASASHESARSEPEIGHRGL